MHRISKINKIDLLAVSAVGLLVFAVVVALSYTLTIDKDNTEQLAKQDKETDLNERLRIEDYRGNGNSSKTGLYRTVRSSLGFDGFWQDHFDKYGTRTSALSQFFNDGLVYVYDKTQSLVSGVKISMQNTWERTAGGIKSIGDIDVGGLVENVARQTPTPATIVNAIRGTSATESRISVRDEPNVLFSTKEREFSVATERSEMKNRAKTDEDNREQGAVLGQVKALGESVTQAAASVQQSLKEIFAGSESQSDGVTLFDRKTGKPYCVEIVNGAMATRFGTCESEWSDKTVEVTGGTSSSPVLD